MSLFANAHVINDAGNKSAVTAISRRDGEFRPEVQIVKGVDPCVVFSMENWNELIKNAPQFTEFFENAKKNSHIQLFSDAHLTYVYTRSKFGDQLLCVSQIRRNSESAKYPTCVYFSKDSWFKLLEIAPLINYELAHLSKIVIPVEQKLLPAISRAVFQLGGITCDSAASIMRRPNSLDFLTYKLDEIDFYSSARIFHEIIYYHPDIVWEIIFKNEIQSA
jgi:hypothetical protein